MPVTLEQFGIDRLSAEDQLELIGLLWDRVSAADGGLPVLTPELNRLIDERIAEADAHPEAMMPWEEVRARWLSES